MHSPTLLLAVLILVALMTIITFVAWRLNTGIGGLREWFFAFFSALLNISLYLTQPDIPSAVNTMLLQVLQLSTGILGLIAMYRYLERDDIPYVRILAPAAAVLLCSLVIEAYWGRLQLIFAISSVMTGIYYLAISRIMWPGRESRYPARRMFSLVALVHGLFMCGRIALFTQSAPGQMFNQGAGLTGPQLILIEQVIIVPMLALGLLMLANEKNANELRSQAEIDSLTDLYNRRAFLRSLEQARSFAKRTQTRLCLLALDIDHFKSINDSYGHDVGDAVLKSVTTTILGCLRKEDVMGRLGGEEFAIFTLNTDPASALRVAERIRAKVNATPMVIRDHRISCSASIGISHFDGEESIEKLLRRADQAMYLAKANGRNRVEFALN